VLVAKPSRPPSGYSLRPLCCETHPTATPVIGRGLFSIADWLRASTFPTISALSVVYAPRGNIGCSQVKLPQALYAVRYLRLRGHSLPIAPT